MSIFNVINLVWLLTFTVIGLIVGLVKGFKRVKSWGSDYLLSALSTIGIGAILKNCGIDTKIAGIVVLSCAIATLFLFMGLSALIRNLISRSFERREDDMRTFGWVGVINRIFGGFALAIKGFVIAAIVCVIVYVALDLTQIAPVKTALSSIYQGKIWISIKPYLFDLIILGIINLAVRHGYSSGISSALWSLIVLALLIGCGFAAYNMVFKSTLFDGAANSLSIKIGNRLPNIQNYSLTISKWIFTALIFIAFAIVTAIISFFASRVLTFARAGSAFYVADGILGSFVLTLIIVGVMMFVGFMIQPVYDLDFMKPLTDYFADSAVAKFFYTNNLLTGFGVPDLLPLRNWFAPQA